MMNVVNVMVMVLKMAHVIVTAMYQIVQAIAGVHLLLTIAMYVVVMEHHVLQVYL